VSDEQHLDLPTHRLTRFAFHWITSVCMASRRPRLRQSICGSWAQMRTLSIAVRRSKQQSSAIRQLIRLSACCSLHQLASVGAGSQVTARMATTTAGTCTRTTRKTASSLHRTKQLLRWHRSWMERMRRSCRLACWPGGRRSPASGTPQVAAASTDKTATFNMPSSPSPVQR
jgi:hypothetical protein